MKLEKKKIAIAVAVILVLILIAVILGGNSNSSEEKYEDSNIVSEVDDQQEKITFGEELTEKPDADEIVEENFKSGTKEKTLKQSETKNQSNYQKQENNKTGMYTPEKRPEIHFAPSKNDGSSSKEENRFAQIADGKITCDSFGRYTGQYVEDGRDELVESVATVLITNRSDEYLEYATLTFDVDGSAANFIVTGLPSGASAWVMDAGKLAIKSGASFTYQDCVSDFRSDVNASSDEVGLKADGNMLTATNKTDKTLEDVVVYYRVMHTDGNYLGGVTYTANFDTLEPGESTEVLAGHYSAENSEVVRVNWSN